MSIRRIDRCATDLPVALQSNPRGPRAEARLVDLSPEGIGIEHAGAPIHRDDPVYVEIPRRDGFGRVGLLARVAWTDRERAGLAIEAMLPHHRERLEILLAGLRTP